MSFKIFFIKIGKIINALMSKIILVNYPYNLLMNESSINFTFKIALFINKIVKK